MFFFWRTTIHLQACSTMSTWAHNSIALSLSWSPPPLLLSPASSTLSYRKERISKNARRERTCSEGLSLSLSPLILSLARLSLAEKKEYQKMAEGLVDGGDVVCCTRGIPEDEEVRPSAILVNDGYLRWRSNCDRFRRIQLEFKRIQDDTCVS